MTVQSTTLQKVVLTLCPDIQSEIGGVSNRTPAEEEVRRELVACLLSSQIRHDTSVAWSAAFEKAGLMSDRWWRPRKSSQFLAIVRGLLSGEHPASEHLGRYRFYSTRAQQLARARDAVAAGLLQSIIASDGCAIVLRRAIVRDVPGLGPKQASMLLRNLGVTLDLAIIDTHVMRFMNLMGLAPETSRYSRMSEYERVEQSLVQYASQHGYSVGCMDWAIWVTMRAAGGHWE